MFGQFQQVKPEWFLKCGQVVPVAALAVAVCKAWAAWLEVMQNTQYLLQQVKQFAGAPAAQVAVRRVIYAVIADVKVMFVVQIMVGVHAS